MATAGKTLRILSVDVVTGSGSGNGGASSNTVGGTSGGADDDATGVEGGGASQIGQRGAVVGNFDPPEFVTERRGIAGSA